MSTEIRARDARLKPRLGTAAESGGSARLRAGPSREFTRAVLAMVLLTASPPARLSAQDSQFGIRGLGTPDRWESIRARTTGGAFAAFDALSPTADAALIYLPRLTATAAAAATYRTVELGGEDASLQSTRFPTLGLGGPITARVRIGGGFTSYLGRSYRATTRDSMLLRGEWESFTDDVTSEGGVTDLRLGAAWRPASRVAVGGSFHILTGSTRVTAVRRYDDSTSYLPAGEVDNPRFDGLGVSAGVLVDLRRNLHVAGYLRSDNRLRYKTRDTTGAYDLPVTWGAAILWRPGTQAAFAAAVQASSWGSAEGLGLPSHDTFAWSAGLEVGRPTLPLRLGVRGGQLPFGPGAEAPDEYAAALGTGFRFSNGRAMIDLGLERVEREGGGLRERSWNVLVGITVRP
jgi:hypothetical protein